MIICVAKLSDVIPGVLGRRPSGLIGHCSKVYFVRYTLFKGILCEVPRLGGSALLLLFSVRQDIVLSSQSISLYCLSTKCHHLLPWS